MTKEEFIKHIHANKDVIIAQKKAIIKKADAVNGFAVVKADKMMKIQKAEIEGESDSNFLNAKLIINTCNIIDSHTDCHINGIWNKTVKETKVFFLLQEHDMEFEGIIADSVNDDLKAAVEVISWSDLGQSYKGNTEALVFNVKIPKRNEYMFEQYKNGYVLNHSVGMRYVKIFLCINSEESMYSQEKESWDKYYPMVQNKELADEKGYFWAVTEARMVEGSAVVKGSNEVTPVMEIELGKNEPPQGTQETEDTTEPPEGTQEKKSSTNLLLLS